ncbi:MAG: glycosyltransferase [Proteobacteria bacterium]|nr:glycosyltransferase [Pseudomonadota bacterium]
MVYFIVLFYKGHMQNEILFVITTANHLPYTRNTVDSLRKTVSYPKLDILVIDDASTDGTEGYCRTNGIRCITKEKPQGLTDSWNRAYGEFEKNPHYRLLFIVNNDILIPEGALEPLIESLGRHIIVGPITSLHGAGHQPLQAMEAYYDCPIDIANPRNYQQVQDWVKSHCTQPEKSLPFINGYFFGMNRKVLAYRLREGILFNPSYTNIHNESELCKRIPEEKVCRTDAFIYHFKGVSFSAYRDEFGNFVIPRNLTWTSATFIRKHPLLFRLFAWPPRTKQLVKRLLLKIGINVSRNGR